MDDNQSYTNYLARLFGLIIALFLFGMAIWLVVRVVQRDNRSEVAVTETTAVVETTGNLDVIKGESDNRDFVIVTTPENSQTVTVSALPVDATDGQLPNTGPETSFAGLAALSLLAAAVWQLRRSRRQLNRPA